MADSDLAAISSCLEEFLGGNLQSILSSFVQENKGRFQPPATDGEHSLVNTELFNEYSALVEQSLSTLLESRDLSSEGLYSLAKDLHESGEQDLKFELGYLLATTDFDQFEAVFQQECASKEEDPWGTGGGGGGGGGTTQHNTTHKP